MTILKYLLNKRPFSYLYCGSNVTFYLLGLNTWELLPPEIKKNKSFKSFESSMIRGLINVLVDYKETFSK